MALAQKPAWERRASQGIFVAQADAECQTDGSAEAEGVRQRGSEGGGRGGPAAASAALSPVEEKKRFLVNLAKSKQLCPMGKHLLPPKKAAAVAKLTVEGAMDLIGEVRPAGAALPPRQRCCGRGCLTVDASRASHQGGLQCSAMRLTRRHDLG